MPEDEHQATVDGIVAMGLKVMNDELAAMEDMIKEIPQGMGRVLGGVLGKLIIMYYQGSGKQNTINFLNLITNYLEGIPEE